MKPKRKLTRVGRGILETEDKTKSPSVPGLVWVMNSCGNSLKDWVKLIDDRLLPHQPRLRSRLSPDLEWTSLPPGWSSEAVVSSVELPGSSSFPAFSFAQLSARKPRILGLMLSCFSPACTAITSTSTAVFRCGVCI